MQSQLTGSLGLATAFVLNACSARTKVIRVSFIEEVDQTEELSSPVLSLTVGIYRTLALTVR